MPVGAQYRRRRGVAAKKAAAAAGSSAAGNASHVLKTLMRPEPEPAPAPRPRPAPKPKPKPEPKRRPRPAPESSSDSDSDTEPPGRANHVLRTLLKSEPRKPEPEPEPKPQPKPQPKPKLRPKPVPKPEPEPEPPEPEPEPEPEPLTLDPMNGPTYSSPTERTPRRLQETKTISGQFVPASPGSPAWAPTPSDVPMITRYLDGQYYDRNSRAQHPLYRVSPSSSRAERENALREDSLRRALAAADDERRALVELKRAQAERRRAQTELRLGNVSAEQLMAEGRAVLQEESPALFSPSVASPSGGAPRSEWTASPISQSPARSRYDAAVRQTKQPWHVEPGGTWVGGTQSDFAARRTKQPSEFEERYQQRVAAAARAGGVAVEEARRGLHRTPSPRRHAIPRTASELEERLQRELVESRIAAESRRTPGYTEHGLGRSRAEGELRPAVGPVTEWLLAIRLQKMVAMAQASGLVSVANFAALSEEQEILREEATAPLPPAERNRLRRELRALRSGEDFVAEFFRKRRSKTEGSFMEGPSWFRLQAYAKPEILTFVEPNGDHRQVRTWMQKSADGERDEVVALELKRLPDPSLAGQEDLLRRSMEVRSTPRSPREMLVVAGG